MLTWPENEAVPGEEWQFSVKLLLTYLDVTATVAQDFLEDLDYGLIFSASWSVGGADLDF